MSSYTYLTFFLFLSHKDWTERAVTAGLHPMAVEWPFSKELEKRGFVDAYRQVRMELHAYLYMYMYVFSKTICMYTRMYNMHVD